MVPRVTYPQVPTLMWEWLDKTRMPIPCVDCRPGLCFVSFFITRKEEIKR